MLCYLDVWQCLCHLIPSHWCRQLLGSGNNVTVNPGARENTSRASPNPPVLLVFSKKLRKTMPKGGRKEALSSALVNGNRGHFNKTVHCYGNSELIRSFEKPRVHFCFVLFFILSNPVCTKPHPVINTFVPG